MKHDAGIHIMTSQAYHNIKLKPLMTNSYDPEVIMRGTHYIGFELLPQTSTYMFDYSPDINRLVYIMSGLTRFDVYDAKDSIRALQGKYTAWKHGFEHPYGSTFWDIVLFRRRAFPNTVPWTVNARFELMIIGVEITSIASGVVQTAEEIF